MQQDEWDTVEIPYIDPSNGITVCEYNPEHFDGVRNLYFSTYKELAQNNSSIRTYIRKSFKSAFEKDTHLLKKIERNKLWVALNTHGNVVGMAGIRIGGADSYEIQKLAVAVNYRRHGISNKLWEVLESVGRDSCPTRPLQVRLSTISLLSIAESYYEKKGFQMKSRVHLNGYDLDVFEKTIS